MIKWILISAAALIALVLILEFLLNSRDDEFHKKEQGRRPVPDAPVREQEPKSRQTRKEFGGQLRMMENEILQVRQEKEKAAADMSGPEQIKE